MEWHASADVDWIILGGTEGKLSGGREIQLLALVKLEVLEAGAYEGKITISAEGAQGSPAQVKASLTLTSSPRLEVSPSSLNFQTEEGGANPEPQAIVIKNAGGGLLNWTATADVKWLLLGASRGSLAAGLSTEVKVFVNISGLAAGTYQGRITVTAPEGQGSPAVVTVSLEVRPRTLPAPALGGMVLIPAGSFQMGDSFGEGDSDERPVHTVTVSAFYMDRYEVTKALWDEVASWAAANGYDIKPEDGSGKAKDHPVYYVSWYEAVKWANARSEREGLAPCYTLGGKVYRTGQSAPDCNWSASGYRLATEAEWEKAARGGLSGQRYPWGNDIDCARANYNYYRCVDDTTPVGSYPPNGYGLYDMVGNVWEWCWDWYSENYYLGSPGSDPRGPATSTAAWASAS